MGATERILQSGSFDPSHGLDEFLSESEAARATTLEIPPDASAQSGSAAVLITVPAHTSHHLLPSTSTDLARLTHTPPPLVPRSRPHVARKVARRARAVLLAPFHALAFVVVRLSWLLWWMAYGLWWSVTGGVRLLIVTTWRGIAGACAMTIAGVRAVGRAVLAVVSGIGRSINAAGAAVAWLARTVVNGIAHAIASTIGFAVRVVTAIGRGVRLAVVTAVMAIVNTIASIGRAIAAAVRAVVFGIWRLVTGTVALVVAAVNAVRRGVAAALAFVWRTITACGSGIAAAVRAVVFGVWRLVTGTAAFTVGGARAVRRGAAATRAGAWRALAACGAGLTGFARTIVRGIATGVLHTIAFVTAVLVASGRGGQAAVSWSAMLTVSALATVAGAMAAIAWAIVVGVWRAAKGTVRLALGGMYAGVRGIITTIAFLWHTTIACGVGLVTLGRAALYDVHASFARTSAAIQRGSDATAARCAQGLDAVGRSLSSSVTAGSRAAARGGAVAGTLTGTLQQSAHRAKARGAVIATHASGATMHAGQSLTALAGATAARARRVLGQAATTVLRRATALARRLRETAVQTYSRVHGAATARVAPAGMPSWVRHGVMTPTMVAMLGATLATSSGMLMMSWPSAAPSTPAPPASASDGTSPRPAALPMLSSAVTQRLLPAAAVTLEARPRPARVAAKASAAAKAPVATMASTRVAESPARVPAEPAGRSVNATQVRALWGKADTRSLDRALAAVRSATLAFERCRLQMTSEDEAVAYCDESRAGQGSSASRLRPLAWTIDFRRSDARWLIERISTSRTASNR